MRLAVAILPILLIASGLSGCFWFGAHCGPFYEDATWREPGLFSALSDVPAEAPASGFPFQHPAAEERWGPHYVVSHVSFAATQDAHHRMDLRVSLSPPMTGTEATPGRSASDVTVVHMQGPSDTPDERWRNFLDIFLDATDVVVDDREAWITAFLSDRTIFAQSYDPRTGHNETLLGTSRPVQQEPDLNELAAKLGPRDETDPARPEPMTFRWTSDNDSWEFTFRLSTRTILIQSTAEGETEELSVNAADHASVTIQQDVGGNETLVKDWLRERFEARGLPEPTFEDFQIAASIC